MATDLKFANEALEALKKDFDIQNFFNRLGYKTLTEPLKNPYELSSAVSGYVSSFNLISDYRDGIERFQILHVELNDTSFKRTVVRKIVEDTITIRPLNALFVFTLSSDKNRILLVSPRRIPDLRNPGKVRLWSRFLNVDLRNPFRTDLEVISSIQASSEDTSDSIWEKHKVAFSVEKVSDKFYSEFMQVFRLLKNYVEPEEDFAVSEREKWKDTYVHLLLNRILFIYFLSRKGWLKGPDGTPERYFMKNFWQEYRNSGQKDKFHELWLKTLFFEAFNKPRSKKQIPKSVFPKWIETSLLEAPYLNGGLYSHMEEIDGKLKSYIPDEAFEKLFERWLDGTEPGFFERYNFTVIESQRFEDEVAVDPEIIGTVYERLVNMVFESGKEEREAGVFYTPQTEIDLMCRLALVDWLSQQLGEEKKNILYYWVFAFTEEEKEQADKIVFEELNTDKLRELITKVTICDPACGSGSFPVGMMLVLDDLRQRLNKILGIEETAYHRRREILKNQLYGVDVMEWAVRVAELRLWLQLVVETEIEEEELRKREEQPLLPNLDFKLVPGDSIVQLLGSEIVSVLPITQRYQSGYLPEVMNELKKLNQEKQAYFDTASKREKRNEILQKELEILHAYLEKKLEYISEQISKKTDEVKRTANMFDEDLYKGKENEIVKRIKKIGQETENLKDKKASILKELQAVKRLLENNEVRLKPEFFFWEKDFVEIFSSDNPGFDIVISNPPYVRQEEICDYLGRVNKVQYKEYLKKTAESLFPLNNIPKRSDLYVYFYIVGLALLKERGTLCFITSNSWLDVDYGKKLQEFFLKQAHLKMVIENQKKRSFAHADINTVIVLASPQKGFKTDLEFLKSKKAKFVLFKKSFEEVSDPVIFAEIDDESLYEKQFNFKVLEKEEYRSRLVDTLTLLKEGLSIPENKKVNPSLLYAKDYLGDKWGGKYLRAPDIFYRIIEKAQDKFVRLGDIAEIKRGFTTGANEFFYLEPLGMTVKEVVELSSKDPYAKVPVRNSAGWEGEIEAEFLKPLIKSPRELTKRIVRLEDLNHLVFICNKSERELRGTKALEFIKWGERQGYHERPSCKSRSIWWDLGEWKISKNILTMFEGERKLCFFNHGNSHIDAALYWCYTNIINEANLNLILNSTIVGLWKEILCRPPEGLGSLQMKVYNYSEMPIPAVQSLKFDDSFFSRFINEKIYSIFTELGFNPEEPIREQEPNPLSHRKELDDIVFDFLGLTEQERKEVYWAVAELVKSRLDRARSV